MTLAQLSASISHAELVGWMGYDLVEPIGQRRIDDGNRLLAALMVNLNKSRDAPAVDPSDFLKCWEPPAPAEAFDEEEAALRLAAFFERRIQRQE